MDGPAPMDQRMMDQRMMDQRMMSQRRASTARGIRAAFSRPLLRSFAIAMEIVLETGRNYHPPTQPETICNI